jgi:membrane glycosyltransferase
MIDDPGLRRRLVLAVLVFGGSAAATRFLASVLGTDGLSIPETGILVVFCVTFGWLAYGFWTALAGFLVTLAGGRGMHALAEAPSQLSSSARTALVVPVYHEDPDRVAARLRVILRSLERTGHLSLFDLFILSDSRAPDRIRAEQAVWARLCKELSASGRLFYRNRAENRGRKAGNIAEFCRRWGRHYRYFVVLDADSVMAGNTLVRLVGMMEANPGAGLLQTLPQPIGGETLFARALQFAASLYGPIYAAGLAYWFPARGNYWGHNAIIRTQAFMAAAGLPSLSGRPPLGGEILSHDFVEAALLQRAGWSVWLVPELGGSYEELPSTLRGYLARDRRWCQGNLQHARLLAAKGLAAVSRLHLALGAMSYAVSLLWLLLLVLTTVEAARTHIWGQVTVHAASLFFQPWPVADPHQLIGLAWITVAMLLLPKLLPLALALAQRARRRAFGGGLRLLRTALAELALSVLLAPVLMIQHSKAVLGVLLGRGVAWTAQQRDGQTESWTAVALSYGDITLLGCLWAAAAYLVAPGLMLWLGPVLAGLVLAIPLAVLSGRSDLGAAMRRRGWFLTPEECAPPPELADLSRAPVGDDRRPDDGRVVAPGGAWPRAGGAAAAIGPAVGDY